VGVVIPKGFIVPESDTESYHKLLVREGILSGNESVMFLTTIPVTAVNIPKPSEMLVRLFILAGYPLRGRNRGEHVLSCMRALCSNIKEELVELWEMVLPKLLSYLQGTYDSEFMSIVV
jgi:hypothetical protein